MNFIDKKTNEIKENKKDPSIELLRIIGCLNVIARHIKLNLKKKKSICKFFFYNF
jgi:peptidoglycan/LPS O-acetylase OafA/YrhL